MNKSRKTTRPLNTHSSIHAVCMTPNILPKEHLVHTNKQPSFCTQQMMLNVAHLICFSSSHFQLDSLLHFSVTVDSLQALTNTQQLPFPQSKTNAQRPQRAGLFNAWAQKCADWSTHITPNTLRTHSIFMTSFEPANQWPQKFTAVTSSFIHKSQKILRLLRSQGVSTCLQSFKTQEPAKKMCTQIAEATHPVAANGMLGR